MKCMKCTIKILKYILKGKFNILCSATGTDCGQCPPSPFSGIILGAERLGI